MTGFLAILRKNRDLFLSDPKGLFLTFLMPVVIASLAGAAFSGMGGGEEGGNGESEARKVPLLVVDEDATPASRKLVDRLAKAKGIEVQVPEGGLAAARDAIRLGKRPAALVIPKGTGEALERGLFAAAFSGRKPKLALLVDPSRQMETGMLRGVLFQEVMAAAAGDLFSAEGGRRMMRTSLEDVEKAGDLLTEEKAQLREAFGLGLQFMERLGDAAPRVRGEGAPGGGPAGAGGMPQPFEIAEEAVTAGGRSNPFQGYSNFAHAFAGMGVMFLLFGVLDGGLLLIRERARGTLARIVASPTPASALLLGEAVWLVGMGVLQLAVMLAVAHLPFFGVRVQGSWAGLALIAVATSAAGAGFGLAIAAFFRTEKAAQGAAILVILVMSALGGSWWPLFITPKPMQDMASWTITKWAVGGLEGALWRGWSLAEIAPSAGILAGMAALLGGIAWARFKFE
ncbi:MAG: ABC transporter permease [Planctomycetales bacterium]|nr:ABC transporter permease [Planctomycetales bacterium]